MEKVSNNRVSVAGTDVRAGLNAGVGVLMCVCLALLLAACGGKQQPATTVGGTVFDISPEILASHTDTLINIGRLSEGEVVKYDALIRNAGSEPLVIKSITTSCGCTSAEYEKQPIAPGETGQFSFRFDSRGFRGIQIKLIEIKTSASPRDYKIMMQAEVEPAASR